jgi:predicted nucleic acid-binding protein
MSHTLRVLLDTNVLIHREARTVVRDDIGELFRWLDILRVVKCVHPFSRDEVNKHSDPVVVRTLRAKIGSYHVLRSLAPDTPVITQLRSKDRTDNDRIDTSMLAEVDAGRVDYLITEDRGIHRKAATIGLSAKVFTIDSFLEKVLSENPELSDYKVLAVRKMLFGRVDIADSFFDSFREDYPGFDQWFSRKADETAYVCTADGGNIIAFLYLKKENPGEDYSDLSPVLPRASRLKIGTFKVVANGFKLGERFLKVVFDNALLLGVDEIYVTIFENRPDQDRLIRLLEDWGFVRHGKKSSVAGEELVLVRDCRPYVDPADPRRAYPYVSGSTHKFIVPIYPKYHTELLPDSILNTETPYDFLDSRPNRNAISKAYISRSVYRDLTRGDLIVFYRTASVSGPAHYTSVATTIGVVQDVVDGIGSLDDFIALCRKRSVFTDNQLEEHWNYNRSSRPFVVNFLYVYSLPKRPNLKQLRENSVIIKAPRGFEPLSELAFATLLKISNADQRLIVR